MTDVIVTLNAGSSNLKYSVYRVADMALADKDKIEFDHCAAKAAQHSPLANAVDRVIALVENRFGQQSIVAVGHRVVHGGDQFVEPTRVSAQVVADLKKLIPLAPLHLPAELDAIDIITEHYPQLPQVICFDTAFHQTQMPLSEWFALTRELKEQGVKRYGFHGLSYQYIAQVLADNLQPEHRQRVIVAHLGNGASMCAMANGQSVTTTMGFTALDGLMMGTRCGELDAGVVLHLCQEQGWSLEQVQTLLYKQSGLLGVSGISSDMRALENSPAPEALEARQLFAFRAAQKLASLIPALQGLDAIVFTGGIGEHSAATRQMIIEHLGWLGAELNVAANSDHNRMVHLAGSAVGIYIIPTNEELMIARDTAQLLNL